MINRIRKYVMDTLGFSRTEANGILILILLILAFAILPRIYLLRTRSDTEKFTGNPEKIKKWAAELEASFKDPIEESKPAAESAKTFQKFEFNPNTVSEIELEKLGFSGYAIQNLLRYREAGGSFNEVNDLKKIYGISPQRIEDLSPYIRLPKPSTPGSKKVEKVETMEPTPAPIELNTAGAEVLQRVPGIGPVLSTRIVAFRDKLGGFYDLHQLYEVYGLDSTVVETLLSQSILKEKHQKININTDSIKHLYTHPYLDYNTAKTIINYRKQHGRFEQVEQVKLIKIISDSLYQKIYPYLSIDL